jgi:hypothetical protein
LKTAAFAKYLFESINSAGTTHRGAQAIRTILIKCPETGRWVSTGIDIEQRAFTRLPNVVATMRCSECGREHAWSKRDAMISPLATTGSQSGKALFKL